MEKHITELNYKPKISIAKGGSFIADETLFDNEHGEIVTERYVLTTEQQNSDKKGILIVFLMNPSNTGTQVVDIKIKGKRITKLQESDQTVIYY